APAVWCMLETPRGILNAAAIAGASPRVGALVMGTSDLTKDLHARPVRDRVPLLTSLQLCVLAARAAGVVALDGVHLDLEDDAGFAAACRQAADLGFDGKTLIHPRQVAAANEAFAPAAREVYWARRVSRPTPRRPRPAAAWWSWTGASSRACTSTTRAACWRWPTPSRRAPRAEAHAGRRPAPHGAPAYSG